jgi:hypothetical protein
MQYLTIAQLMYGAGMKLKGARVISPANFRPPSVCIIKLVIIFIGLIHYVSLGVSACYVTSHDGSFMTHRSISRQPSYFLSELYT